jgi:hypothetical protein
MKKFLEKYTVTNNMENKIIAKERLSREFNGEIGFLYDFMVNHGGKIFNNGLFKIDTFEYLNKWTKLLSEYFKAEINPFDMVCFASNWQGLMYCVDYKNENITYFDPATCEYFKANFSFEELFDNILVSEEYDIIFEEYWEEAFKKLKIKTLEYENSIGHKKYLHLGGKDDIKNLEIVNTEILWEMQIQVAERMNDMNFHERET